MFVERLDEAKNRGYWKGRGSGCWGNAWKGREKCPERRGGIPKKEGECPVKGEKCLGKGMGKSWKKGMANAWRNGGNFLKVGGKCPVRGDFPGCHNEVQEIRPEYRVAFF